MVKLIQRRFGLEGFTVFIKIFLKECKFAFYSKRAKLMFSLDRFYCISQNVFEGKKSFNHLFEKIWQSIEND
jgi:hypothetical protein